MNLFTIGFTRKSASQFFGLLQAAGVRRLVDIRLNNTSQMAGFSKRDDLAYFTRQILGIDYLHETRLAPSQEILDDFRLNGDWARYESGFLALLDQRRVAGLLDRALFDDACLLCSEPTAGQCHRRLAAEFLAKAWGGASIRHL